MKVTGSQGSQSGKGIWINDHHFLRFAEPGLSLAGQIATRERSIDYFALNSMLPNPDPVLKAKGQDIRIYTDLRADAHVGGCIRRRKSAVKALEWGLDRGQSKSRIARNIEAIFADLALDAIIGQILEAPLFGYQPLEITWQKVGPLVVPVDLVAKPQHWFCYDTANQLRFRTKERPFDGEPVPDRKFIVARQDATYANPYGQPDLAMCFWPIVFKKGGVKFWVNFAEKYGTPWAVGKLPRGTPPKDINEMADQLQAMIQDAVAVIPDDGSMEIVEAAGKAASADLYERLVMYCRSEVSIALTGTNQTVEANSNRASATAGLEVAEDLRDGDAEIAAEALNQLIRWTCEMNWGEVERPVFSFWDQRAQDVMQAQRDESVAKAGGRFSNRYWQRAYGYQEGDLQPERSATTLTAAANPDAAFAELADDPAQTALDEAATATIADLAGAGQDFIAPVVAAIMQSADYGEAFQRLGELWPQLDTAEIERRLGNALTAAEAWGRLTAKDEA